MKIIVWLGEAEFEKSTKISINPTEFQICSGRYVVVRCGDQIFETSVVKTSNPRYLESFEIIIIPTQRPIIMFEYFEKIMVKGDLYKAFVMFETSQLEKGKEQEEWIEFSNGGRMRVKFRLCE